MSKYIKKEKLGLPLLNDCEEELIPIVDEYKTKVIVHIDSEQSLCILENILKRNLHNTDEINYKKE